MLPKWAATTRDTNRQNFNKHVKTNLTFWNTPITEFDYKAVLAFLKGIGGPSGSENLKRNAMRLVRPAFDRAAA
jgi:hypothetical protein